MKMKPKTELPILAAVLLALAGILTIGTVVLMPNVLTILHTPWQRIFTSQFYHYHITAMIRNTVFILFPCIVAVNALVACGSCGMRRESQMPANFTLDREQSVRSVSMAMALSAAPASELRRAT
jgi:hypothetical protein